MIQKGKTINIAIAKPDIKLDKTLLSQNSYNELGAGDFYPYLHAH